ncbi:hypothetical protein BP00DRAFT_424228 [Aspergillus indologenus CBS 114.80]|uniref:Uncharacterized protein n=1 Tax=Aspergillus indologenus CBS 114.80 TaxID=1450541 RepID=A0A2V5IG47_9EURO|nr:hypothetical protein BP00DRAFT_424228 [Aspergillus indologenus CBS 114.80]
MPYLSKRLKSSYQLLSYGIKTDVLLIYQCSSYRLIGDCSLLQPPICGWSSCQYTCIIAGFRS